MSTSTSMSLLASKTTLVRVIGHWVPSHCTQARASLRSLLGLQNVGGRDTNDNGENKKSQSGYHVIVETPAGAIVAQFHVDADATLRDVKTKIAEMAPKFAISEQQLLVVGHIDQGILTRPGIGSFKNAVERVLRGTALKLEMAKSVNPKNIVVRNTNDSLTSELIAPPIPQSNCVNLKLPAKASEQEISSEIGANIDANANTDSADTSSNAISENISESGGDGAGDKSAVQTSLQLGDEVTLCLTLRTARWSKSRSQPYLEFSQNDQRVKRPGSRSNYPCAVGSIRLTEPGHFFTVRVVELPKSANALTIGIGPEQGSYRLHGGRGIGAEPGTIGAWVRGVGARIRNDNPAKCVRVLGREVEGPELKVWKPGDRLTFSLEKCAHEKGSNPDLQLAFALNDKVYYTVRIPKEVQPPFVPLCTLPNDCMLEMLQGVGDVLDEP